MSVYYQLHSGLYLRLCRYVSAGMWTEKKVKGGPNYPWVCKLFQIEIISVTTS